MQVKGGINYFENGLTSSIRAMHVQSELMGIANENVLGFDKVGYQRKDAVTSSFTEFLGVHGISKVTDDKTGRIAVSENPLDIALANKGYFQTMSKDGIKLTRDGRFKLDKDGNLLTLDDSKVVGNDGSPIKFSVLPQKLTDIKVDTKGEISVFDTKTNKMVKMGSLGVVASDGSVVLNPDVKQGYNEYSNVSLQNEFMGMMPVLRNFEANRQIYMIQSQNLTKAISQLGSPS